MRIPLRQQLMLCVFMVLALAGRALGDDPRDYGDPGGGGGGTPPAGTCPGGTTKVFLSGMSFSPQTVTVAPGTTVCWQNNDGTHSVLSDTGLFHSGSPADSGWFYSYVFSNPGTYPYHCEVHGDLGMRGTVVVSGSGGTSSPGVLKFTQTAWSVGEGAGTAAISVGRSNGGHGAVSVTWSAGSGTAAAGSDFNSASGTLSWADGDEANKTFSVVIVNDSAVEGHETVKLSLTSPTGGATLDATRKNATLTIQDNDAPGSPPAVPANLQAQAEEGSTTAIHLTWTDTSTNDTGFRVERRTLTGSFEEIASLAADTTSYSAEGASGEFYVFRVRAAGSQGTFSGFSNLAAAASNVPPAPCVASSTALCINDGNFAVQARWRTADQNGDGSAVPLASSPDSGLFYFFNAGNIEALVKVLDGCGLNERYWVFFAATTNVEFALIVTDSRSGKVRAYFNPLNQAAAPVQDTSAFATCP